MAIPPFGERRHRERSGDGLSLSELRREMERFVENLREHPLGWLPEGLVGSGSWTPPVDMVERADEFVVRIEVPGVDPAGLDVTVSGNALTVSGEKKRTLEKIEGGREHIEARYGPFTRTVTLPEDVDPQNVDAECRHGVLIVHLKKTQEAQARRIQVRTESQSAAPGGGEAS